MPVSVTVAMRVAELPTITSPTREAIFRGYEEDASEGFRPHLGASLIGKDCERALWYDFRWTTRSRFAGRVLRLFETGQLEEARLVRNLRRTGATVLEVDPQTGRQWRVEALGGHFGGSHWIGFISCVLVFLALDLGVFHRRAHVVKFKEALAWTAVWFTMAMLFALALRPLRGQTEALEFLTGYLIELSLSMDNVFVIALIFGYFRIPPEYQHRVLFLGIMGALVMRGLMIGAGTALVSRFHWVLYIFGAFLVYSGIKMLLVSEASVDPEKNPVIRLARRFYPVTTEFQGQRFVCRSTPYE